VRESHGCFETRQGFGDFGIEHGSELLIEFLAVFIIAPYLQHLLMKPRVVFGEDLKRKDNLSYRTPVIKVPYGRKKDYDQRRPRDPETRFIF
jgi:hypothetical protein